MQADMKLAMVPQATRLHPQPRQIGFARRRQRPDAAHLNRHRTQVREPAQSVGGDDKRPRIERGSDLAQIHVRHEFIQDQTRAQQIAHRGAIVPFHPQQPGDRREDAPQDRLAATPGAIREIA